MQETDVAQIRFGYGFGPHVERASRAELLTQALARDAGAARYPGITLTDALTMASTFRAARRARRDGAEDADEHFKQARRTLRQASNDGLRTSLARIASSGAPLRERLTWFWADHFTVAARTPSARVAALSFVDEAIRPHIWGSFSDMLKAVIRHPAMLVYLDQHQSIGPDSAIGVRTGRGLNENLARELLELHTMGVGSSYSQSDVRSVAELLTGLSFNQERGFSFRRRAAQPGAETVLGTSYGSDRRAQLSDIDRFLEDLALHPETAAHLARKLAVHFVGQTPPDLLVRALTEAYLKSDGTLAEMTRVLVDHPETATAQFLKVKTPFEFVASSLIALGLHGDDIMRLSDRDLRNLVNRPMAAMGQPWMRPSGPDGWSEDPAHWITPQGLATRISWAVSVADRMSERAGDPRMFLERTLGEASTGPLRFAVSAAETQAEGVALVLASAEFNRR